MQIGEKITRQLVITRNLFLTFAEPLDMVSRTINGKTRWPTLALRRYAGPLSSLESSGAEFLAYIKLLCRVPPSARVLDIGCGFGLMALYLEDYIKPPGTYTGMDINQRAIKWAGKTVTKRHPYFRFIHLDVWNSLYNARGKLLAENLKLPFDNESSDFILLKSVFTHMRPKEVENYFKEMARLLAPDGICLATFFLLNKEQQKLQAKGLNSIQFKFGDALFHYANPAIPEIAIAYEEEELIRMLQDAGLRVQNYYYGTWSGKEDGLCFQDMVLIKKN